jgi:acetylornithine/N-succinyldiaminopimelate aminotransferase
MNLEEAKNLESKYVINTYGRFPLVVEKGEGCYIYSTDGKKYLDFLSGIAVNSLGHSHPNVVKTITEQAKKTIHVSNFYHIPSQYLLGKKLCEISGLDRAFFCNSGAEANEGAIKLARRYQSKKGKDEIIYFSHSFHGRTITTLMATDKEKYRSGFGPFPPGFVKAEFNDVNDVMEKVTNKTAAFLVEPVQGEGGINISSNEFMKTLSDLREDKGILIVFDEVQCGIGRTGKWFAFQHYDIKPDIMTLAKALGGGIPIGSIVAKKEISDILTPGDHGTTFGGNPLATTVALTVLETIESEKLIENAINMGKYLISELAFMRDLPYTKDIRGLGLMVGIEFEQLCGNFVKKCFENNLLINCPRDKVVRLVPPLIVSKKEIDEAIEIMKKSL